MATTQVRLPLSLPLLVVLAACAGRASGPPTSMPQALRETTWRLVELPGTASLVESPATVAFPEEGRVGGSGSCNRYFGGVEITPDAITIGTLGSTKMACPEPVMEQERAFLEAIQKAKRYSVQGKTLWIWIEGSDQPLRFERQEP